MEALSSYKLVEWRFKDFHYFSDLIEFEGPVLVHHYNKASDKHALFYWVDGNDKINRWLCFEVSIIELHDYLYDYISLHDLIKKNERKDFFTTDIDSEFNYGNYQLIPNYALPDTYIPSKESYYANNVTAKYDKLFTKINDLDFLRDSAQKESFDLIIAPRSGNNGVYRGMISVAQGADFLRNWEISFKSYGAYKAHFALKDKFSPLQLPRKIHSIMKNTPALITDNTRSSFKISVATAPVMKQEGSTPEINTFRNSILESYRNDILSIDFNNKEEVDRIVESYDPDSRRLIFDPLIKIINNKDYKLTYVDKKKRKRIEYDKIAKSTRLRLAPKEIKEISEDVKDKVFVTITMALDPDKNLETISKKDILDGTLFASVADNASQELEKIEGDNFSVILSEPINIDYQFHDGSFKVSYPILGIEIINRNKNNALEMFIDAFIESVEINYLAATPKDNRIKKILEEIIGEIVQKNQ